MRTKWPGRRFSRDSMIHDLTCCVKLPCFSCNRISSRFWSPFKMRCICQKRVKEAAKGPGMSLIAEKYRRHMSKLKRLVVAMEVINSQSMMMEFKLPRTTSTRAGSFSLITSSRKMRWDTHSGLRVLDLKLASFWSSEMQLWSNRGFSDMRWHVA